ncbi:hypothetical protein AGLY_015917 [Aphis glycines]|uniref:Uncharacterized protein n=1 Tax=Aphis glycines TaxID=307491 RepID=A0A6G0SZE4_APHGL|nr:hypothetical protein AGLY_015917 [Aphis glycines]
MKKILIKIADNSELERGILPLVNLESAQSIASMSSDVISSSTNTEITVNSELERGILPLVNLESAQSMASVSSDAINSSTNTEIIDDNEHMNSTLQLVDNNFDQSMENASSDTFNSPIRTGKVMSAYLTASETSVDDLPQRSFLKPRKRQLLNAVQIKNSKIKKVQQPIRRRDRKIVAMKEIIKYLKK